MHMSLPVLICVCILTGVRDWYSFHRYAINFAYLEVHAEYYVYCFVHLSLFCLIDLCCIQANIFLNAHSCFSVCCIKLCFAS